MSSKRRVCHCCCGHNILKFDSPAEAAIYERIRHYEFRPARYFHLKSLSRICYPLKSRVYTYLSKIGWQSVASIIDEAYREPTLEFLATFALLDGDDENSVTFQLNGKRFTMSLAKFNFHLGFECESDLEEPEYINALLAIPPEFVDKNFWAEITGGDHHYNPSQSKSSAIRDPSLRLMHNWIAHSFSAGEESADVVTREDLFFLWCMVTGLRCNASRFLLALCAKVRQKSKSNNKRYIAVGSYISFLATELKVLHPRAQMVAKREEFDHEMLQDMGIIYSPTPGKWEIIAPEDPIDADDASDEDISSPIPPNRDAIAPDHIETQTTAQFDQLKAHLDAQDSKLDTLMLNVDTLAQHLNRGETKMTAQFDRLEAHSDAQDAHLVTLEAHLDAKDAQLATLETQMTSRFDQIEARLNAQDATLDHIHQLLQTHFGTHPSPLRNFHFVFYAHSSSIWYPFLEHDMILL